MNIIDMGEIMKTGRVYLGQWATPMLEQLDESLRHLEARVDVPIVQRGRVLAIRSTDWGRVYSAFKAALYLGKYDEMDNRRRFLSKMVKAHHSYEPIRGESIMFLFVGVGKPVYDHLVTHSVGRTARIAGGQRANVPWGFEVPVEAKQPELYLKHAMPIIENFATTTQLIGGEDNPLFREQMQAARSILPVGYIMPPFLLEFSEEALAKTVFPQRLWHAGAQGATVDVVADMLECCKTIDAEKWAVLEDYHGPHILAWEKAMRTLRDKEMTIGDLLDACKDAARLGGQYKSLGEMHHNGYLDLWEVDLYELLMETVGKMPKTMWERMEGKQ